MGDALDLLFHQDSHGPLLLLEILDNLLFDFPLFEVFPQRHAVNYSGFVDDHFPQQVKHPAELLSFIFLNIDGFLTFLVLLKDVFCERHIFGVQVLIFLVIFIVEV